MMKKSLLQILLVAGFGLASHGALADASALLQKGGCVACHSMDGREKLGPALLNVANQYKGKKDAEAYLVNKIKNGGRGVWGPLPMPPQKDNLSDAEIKQVVQWIISL
jgi:cytochrome c